MHRDVAYLLAHDTGTFGVGRMKEYKLMAYILSTGLWDPFGNITLEAVLGYNDEKLENELTEWQMLYENQFKRHQ